MVAQFSSPAQKGLFGAVVSGLDRIGYKDDLLQHEYRFEHWYAARSGVESKVVALDAAAFGRLPFADENACFGIESSNGSEQAANSLVERCRSLCAPVAIEVTPTGVRFWSVRADTHVLVTQTPILLDRIDSYFNAHAEDWNPAAMLRAKNIGPIRARQLDFIDIGLMPAHEEYIRDKLGPLIHNTLAVGLTTYSRRNHTFTQLAYRRLLRLVFRVLTGKVLADRSHPGFKRFKNDPDSDTLLSAVNRHFGDEPQLITDAPTRDAVVAFIWKSFSLRHISASILSLVWENTLVDDDIRKQLGLYGTPASVAKYVIERIGLHEAPEDERFVVEPCCGSGVFLLAAMRRLTELLSPEQYGTQQRHAYLRRMLSGFDVDPFGVEVARDCLMLADYPNRNGWVVREEDVFASPEQSPVYHTVLPRARFVVCNPPFTPDFTFAEQSKYHASSTYKPVELVERVLRSCPSLRGFGFVLPHRIISGIHYRKVRKALAARFGSMDVVSLPPTGVFSAVHYETAVLTATSPRSNGRTVNVEHRTVSRGGWPDFAAGRKVPPVREAVIPVSRAERSIGAPVLQEVWAYFEGYPTVAKVVDSKLVRKGMARGLQWKKSLKTERADLVKAAPEEGYEPGIISASGQVRQYLTPPVRYLSVKKEDQKYDAFSLPWDRPKVLMNANRRGGGHPWQIAAIPDRAGLRAPDTSKALWPIAEWSPELLAAVLNGPLANAYVSTHATGRQLTDEVVQPIPVPRLTPQLRATVDTLVREYIAAAQPERLRSHDKSISQQAQRLLFEIDAAVLQAYDMPPRLERVLLDYFAGYSRKRPVGFPTKDYFPKGFASNIPLHVYLSVEYRTSTAENLLRVIPEITDPELIEALAEV